MFYSYGLIFSLFINSIYVTSGLNVVESKDLIFIILSQTNKYNQQIANGLKSEICNQSFSLNVTKKECPKIYLTHEKFVHVGEWTILPILPMLVNEKFNWFIFIEERTDVKLEILLKTLQKYDYKKKLWIGFGLEDETPTIIHHYNEKKFVYPHSGAGIAFTKPLIKSIAKIFSEQDLVTDFSIDKSYELAKFIWENLNGTHLNHDESFCVSPGKNCATFPKPFEKCNKLETNSLQIAVKTCQKFHENRLPVVLKTWAKYVENLEIFSDITDESIPTISLGVPNTESGHCGKTMAILKYFNEKLENSNLTWLVLVDDDTILSVSRLVEFLSCYDANDDVLIGERYGYSVSNPLGFNYITGGGGMVFSKNLIKKLVKSCKCPSISSPDDMVIGHCMGSLNIRVTHSYLFHQARPLDYAKNFLKSDKHISFHKHWNIDPVQVYRDWFEEDDLNLRKSDVKSEL